MARFDTRKRPDNRKGDRHLNSVRRKSWQAEYGKSHPRPCNNIRQEFIGCDGEGGTLDNGYHAYWLLRVGDQCIRAKGGNVRITSAEALEFLSNLPDDKIYVGFFFDYDVTKILEDLPFEKLDRLVNRDKRRSNNGIQTFPVTWGPYEIEYFPKKAFQVRKRVGTTIGEDGKAKAIWSKWVVINDVGSFFQCKFVEALERWQIGTDDEKALIQSGKDMRSDFSIETGTIDKYNQLEIVLLEKLMEKFRAACIEVGIVPRKWQGPGQLAEAAFRKFGVPESKEIPMLENVEFEGLVEYGRFAFYGGRPEISVIGPVNQVVYQWDINSAYPTAMRYLPCLLHGGWEFVEHWEGEVPKADHLDKTNYAICYGNFEGKEGERVSWYGMPIRDKNGSICYPRAGSGWYWNFEIEASIHQKFTVQSAWVYTRQCDCHFLDYVEDLYEERLRLGKDGAGGILKLLLNSKYGKMVQSVGFPRYANPIWGSFITAFCREMVQEFIHGSPLCKEGKCGRDILAVATDSVSTITDRDLKESRRLGGWSKEIHPNGVFYVQPGLYFGSSGKPPKTRGVPRAAMERMEEEFRANFKRMCESHVLSDGDVRVEQEMFVGIKYALHRKNLKLLGQWIRFEGDDGKGGKLIKFDWTTKRAERPIIEADDEEHPYIETFPKEESPDIHTIPYSKDIGGLILRATMREWFEAQPEWVQTALGD
jgi:hypothetical protein